MALFSYPSSARVRAGWEFDHVFRTGRRAQGRLVRLLYVETEGATRWGIAVGKRQGDAPVRSRGRRILREAIRHLRPWVRPGWLIVVMLRTEGLSAGAARIFADLAATIRKAGLFDETWQERSWENLITSRSPLDVSYSPSEPTNR